MSFGSPGQNAPGAIERSRRVQPRLGKSTASPQLPKRRPQQRPPVKRKKIKTVKTRKKSGFKWDFETVVLSSFVGVVFLALFIFSVFVGIPKAIKQFRLPAENELVEVSGRPLNVESNRVISGRGTYTTLGFKIGDRGFSLLSYDWSDADYQNISDALSGGETIVLTVCADRDAFDHIPFWELKSGNQIVIPRDTMLARHKHERYGFLIAPIVFVGVILIGALVSLFHYLKR